MQVFFSQSSLNISVVFKLLKRKCSKKFNEHRCEKKEGKNNPFKYDITYSFMVFVCARYMTYLRKEFQRLLEPLLERGKR